MFTNVPVDFTLNLLQRYLIEKPINFNLPFSKIKQLIYLTLDNAYFNFEDKYYKQISGLSMGSPLSPIFSNICMELIEYYFIFPKINNLIWYRYVDDIFSLIPKNTNTNTILQFINNIHNNIKFTVEYSHNNSIPFLDTLITYTSTTPLIKIYRKPNSNPSYIHWFSFHNTSTKSAVLSNLFLRSLKLVDPEYLSEEIKYIKNIFKNLQYPNKIITKSFKKAKNKYYNIQTEKFTPKNILPIPNLHTHEIKNSLNNEICIVKSNSIILKHTLKPKINKSDNNIGVYKIPCNQCNKIYIGETNDYKRRLYQHSLDLTNDNKYSSLTNHRNIHNHLPNIQNSQLIKSVQNTNNRKLIETFIIKNTQNINLIKGDIPLDNITNKMLNRSNSLRRTLKDLPTLPE